jgi:hypothetical protein
MRRRGRRNPDTWAGTEKQIEWAQRIRAEAEPVIRDWMADLAAADARDHANRQLGRGFRHRHTHHLSHVADIGTLRHALAITDARFWIDVRSCGDVHTFLAAVERFNGGRRNPGGVTGSLLGIGTLSSLEVENGGKVTKVNCSGRWLAWEPKARKFHICKPQRQRAGADGLSPAIKAAHKKFHSETARKALIADVPTPQGKLKPLGLLRSLVYRVPSRMVISPEKNPYAWHHAFGDTGHKGGAQYPDRVKPQLCRDAKGNLFITRRKGNIFTVDTWLRG